MRSGLPVMIMTRLPIHGFHDLPGGLGFGDPGRWLPLQTNVLDKLRHLLLPGIVGCGILPDRGFGRAHLRQHAVEGQALGSIASAQARDFELGAAPVDLKRKQVFPFRPGSVQRGHFSGRRPEQQERVVFHRHVPEIRSDHSLHLAEVPEKPARQVDEVHALVDQFSAAGFFRNRAPFPVIAGPPAVTVPAADEHHLPQRARFEDLARLAKCTVIAMIEAHPHQRAGAARGLADRRQLGLRPSARLLDQYVLPRGCGFGGDGRQHVVRGGHKHQVEIWPPHRGLPIRGCVRTRHGASQGVRARFIHVAATDYLNVFRGLGPLGANQAAPDYGRPDHVHCFPRSSGTMRRSV
ncbi:hypothetical protein SBA5_870019 [Candidatus Sulfotelmatomonas gaucii]|uniref:Uncharacterized protein n=1 Tax=Candidatus Sulfuritelmatomonas gaucii TaxID=2043161 RepID=A0A2N9M720_9BACT|nr:hypothetical protein SBA5_870019 [Candidatus Sulfotelmatomonas gaucii]